MRADVEDDAFCADRGGGLERRAHGSDGLPVDHRIGGGEIDEVEGVADDAADPGLRAALAEARDLPRRCGSSAATCAGSG